MHQPQVVCIVGIPFVSLLTRMMRFYVYLAFFFFLLWVDLTYKTFKNFFVDFKASPEFTRLWMCSCGRSTFALFFFFFLQPSPRFCWILHFRFLQHAQSVNLSSKPTWGTGLGFWFLVRNLSPQPHRARGAASLLTSFQASEWSFSCPPPWGEPLEGPGLVQGSSF